MTKPPTKAQRQRARVTELLATGATKAEAVKQTARELDDRPARVLANLGRKDRVPPPPRKPNAAKGKPLGALRTADLLAWLRELAQDGRLHTEASWALEEVTRGIERGDVEASRNPFSGKPMPKLTYTPIFKKKVLTAG
jgi:hypothetical protein